MITIFRLGILLVLTQTCLAQPKLTRLTKNTIPKNIEYTGNILQGVRFTDKAGDNIIVFTKTDKTQTKNPDDDSYTDQGLYAYHYLVLGDSVKQTWRVYDYVKECQFDIFLSFLDKAFAVTDLNQDGKAEVWMMYKVSCQSDVSPTPIKIIMYEDNKKYAMRGRSRVKVSATEYEGGEYAFDEAFKNAPAAFKQYAEKLWKAYKEERWGQ